MSFLKQSQTHPHIILFFLLSYFSDLTKLSNGMIYNTVSNTKKLNRIDHSTAQHSTVTENGEFETTMKI